MTNEEATAVGEKYTKLLAENTALRELMNAYNLGGWTDSLRLIKERDELRAQVEALRADAERYRWLRINGIGSWNTPLYPPSLDAAIDAARGKL